MSMMRIGNRAIQYYQKTAAATGVKKAESSSAALSSAKTDQITISHEAAAQSSLGGLVQNIATEVETSVSGARLQQLSAEVAAGSYRIPTEALVDSILGGAY